MKPQQLWSGKQIISTLLLNLTPEDKSPVNLISASAVKPNNFSKDKNKCPHLDLRNLCESKVIFRQGQMVQGILDKKQFGAAAYGLVHSFFELYGGKYSGKLLSAFSKLFTNFLRTEGFTLGVHDIVVTKRANKARKRAREDVKLVGDELAAKAVFGLDRYKDDEVFDEDELKNGLEVLHRQKRNKEVDAAYKEKLSKTTNVINDHCLPRGLVKKFPENNLQLMVQAGAKGSTVNTMQISSCLGQIELEGKRPPLMISGKFIH